MNARLQKLAVLALALAAMGSHLGVEHRRTTADLVDLRGEVVSISSISAEGDLDVVAVVLRTEESAATVLLGPRAVLDDLGFEVEAGDRLRVRVFVEDGVDAPLTAQRVLNLSRQSMMRLRTLHRDPLWDASGRWQGSTFGRGPDPERARPPRERGGGGPGGR
jgi:hypothetical protein